MPKMKNTYASDRKYSELSCVCFTRKDEHVSMRNFRKADLNTKNLVEG